MFCIFCYRPLAGQQHAVVALPQVVFAGMGKNTLKLPISGMKKDKLWYLENFSYLQVLTMAYAQFTHAVFNGRHYGAARFLCVPGN